MTIEEQRANRLKSYLQQEFTQEEYKALMTRDIERMLRFLRNPVIRTSGVRFSICDTEQCCICDVLDDPMLMGEIEGKPFCDECADKYETANEAPRSDNGKLAPPKRRG